MSAWAWLKQQLDFDGNLDPDPGFLDLNTGIFKDSYQWRSNGLFSMCKEQGPRSLRGPLGLN